VIDGLPKLESVKTCYQCFRISEDEREDGICRITNCPNLRSIFIGWGNFVDYHSFELSNVNSLQSLDFGEHSFFYAKEFSLRGMLFSLTNIYVPRGSNIF